MRVVDERCAGLDVHKKSVVACRIIPGAGHNWQVDIRTFSTMTGDLLQLSDWLAEGEVTHVAMESTGVYWKPVHNILEGCCATWIVNARHIKQVPGRIEKEIDQRMIPFDEDNLVDRLCAMPGVSQKVAQFIIPELGTDMSRFPTAKHAASWAGLAPGQNESAGRNCSSRTNKGNTYLKTALVEAAQAAGKSKNNYLAAQFRRLAARRGKKRASVAVARSMLIIAFSYHATWHCLR